MNLYHRKSKVIVGTRGSLLALAQTNQVIKLLAKSWAKLSFKIKIIKSQGDKLLNLPLPKIWGKGLFTKELEDALISGRIDLAVHSLKDLPVEIPEKLEIGAILKREDARDVLIKNPKSEILNPKKVGTSSLRRKAQLLAWKPDLEIVNLRGNLDTRLKKLVEQNLDGIVVSLAGLRRLKIKGLNQKILSAAIMLPAPGQGALAVEIRRNDKRIKKIVTRLNHKPTELEVSAERALLKALGGGCRVPIGAYGKINQGQLKLKGAVVSVDGKICLRSTIKGPKSSNLLLGKKLANKLFKMGASKIL